MEGYYRLAALIISGIIINAITWYWAVRYFPVDDPAAVLHYTVDVGVDFIGEGSHIMALPLIGSLLLSLNIFIGYIVYRADTRASWIIWTSLPVIQALVLMAFFLLWRANVY